MAEKMTIQDIARLAGVSKATVSRVLNHKPDVDPATRERILRIMDERGFVPSIAASGLAGGHSRLIGVLVPDLTWPLVPELIRGVAEIIGTTSYELILYSITTPNHERDRSDVIDRILATKLTSGLLAIYPGQSAHHLVTLNTPDFPVVLVDDQNEPKESLPWIGADNRQGAYDATRHLIQLGHRRIAHIQGPRKYRVSHERREGYYDALREGNIEPDPILLIEGDFMPNGGKECALQLLSLPAHERPTAIFAANDYMAYGVMAAAEEKGLHIPEDVALVGFDDTPPSAHLQPALTTVQQPFYKMGQYAIQLLLQLIDEARSSNARWKRQYNPLSPTPESTPTRIQLSTSLAVRASCGATEQRLFIP